MKIALKEVKVGKLKDGEIIKIEDVTFDGAEKVLDRELTMHVRIDALQDFEGIEMTLGLSDVGGVDVDVNDVEFGESLSTDNFEHNFEFNAVTRELWFAITERQPGTQNMAGNYTLLVATFKKERGTIHVYITLE